MIAVSPLNQRKLADSMNLMENFPMLMKSLINTVYGARNRREISEKGIG